MWHYQKDNQANGPIEQNEIEALIQRNEIRRDTKVWREGMAAWLDASDTELLSLFPQNVPPPVAPPPVSNTSYSNQPAVSGQSNAAEDIKRLNNWFLTFWICLAAGIPLSIVIIGVFGVIAGMVFYFLLLHKLWSLIPSEYAKTSPGKAVGFSFIPFFNFYWAFVAFHGLAQDLNKETTRRSIPNKTVNEGLSLTYCILMCTTIIPYLNILTGIAGIVIWIIVFKQMKDAGVAILEHKVA